MHYHIFCYTKLKNEARASVNKSSNAQTSYARQQHDLLVFAQLVAFVQFNNSAFKLANLRKLYYRRLVQLDSDWIGSYIHPTRFKEHLLQKLGPDWSEYTEGRDIYISHKKTVGGALAQESRIHVSDDEAQKIVEVGLTLRQHILQEQKRFSGSFDPRCLSESVSKPLLTILDVLLEGSSSIEDKVAEHQASISARFRVACTISQQIWSNAAKQSSSALTLYRKKEREIPFTLYVGLKLHASARQKGTINTFHAMGMAVSYDRVMEVRKGLAISVSKRFIKDGVVLPLNIKRGVFTTGAGDNIDESGHTELHGKLTLDFISMASKQKISDHEPRSVFSHHWGEDFNDGNAKTCNACCQESNRFHQPRPNSSDCRRLTALCPKEEMSMGIPWRGRWIKNGVLHGPPAHRNVGETAVWIWLGTDVLHRRRLHSWCCNISTRWQAC